MKNKKRPTPIRRETRWKKQPSHFFFGCVSVVLFSFFDFLFLSFLISFHNLLDVGLLETDSLFLTHGGDDGDGNVLAGLESLGDTSSPVVLRELDIVLGGSVLVHEGEETILGDVEERVFSSGNVGDVHVVGGGGDIFELLAGEDLRGVKRWNQVSHLC